MYATMPMSDITANDEARIVAQSLVDPAAFAPLYERHCPDIYRFCLTRLADHDAANDLTARIFVRAIERLGQYKPRVGASFRSWLFAIARNMLNDEWRRRRDIRPLDLELESAHDDAPGPESIAVHRSEMERLRAVLGQLPDRQRDIIELRILAFTTAEIADALDISLAAVKSAQTRAYIRLRDLLADPKGTHR